MSSKPRNFRFMTFVVLAVVSFAWSVVAQDQPEFFSQPPTSFSAEDSVFPRAVPLPECARRVLARDPETGGPLKYENLSPDQLPADWFTASEQILGQGRGMLVIVMGAKMMRGANVNPFWIFRRTGKACQLLLSSAAHNLEVLRARTNGLPHIKLVSMTAVTVGVSWFKFDGNTYQLARHLSQPIGEEIPKNLAGFETKKPLIQSSNGDSNSILTQARSWLWNKWWTEKSAYLKVTLHSKEGDETTTTYYIEKSAERMSVTIHIHSILVDRFHHPGPRNAVVEDEIIVADDVERRWALAGNPERTKQVPENEEAAPDSYELFFNDAYGNNLLVL